MFNSYKHLKNNKEKFIIFISITVAIGLSIFLAIFIWNLYRSKRLDRIAKSLRQPNLSQSTLCSSASNGNGGRRSSENNITGKYYCSDGWEKLFLIFCLFFMIFQSIIVCQKNINIKRGGGGGERIFFFKLGIILKGKFS